MTASKAAALILPQGHQYPVSYTLGELKELLVELVRLNAAGIREEFQDVAYGLQLLIHQRLGIDFELRLCEAVVQKFISRLQIWERIFSAESIPFDRAFLKGGSNWEKPYKVQAALALAGVTVTPERAAFLVGAVR